MRNDGERERLGRKELVEFQARMGCNEIGALPEVTYPAGCGRSGTYVTNTRSVHVAYRRLSGIITKQSGLPLPEGRATSQHPGSRARISRWHVRTLPPLLSS